MVEATCRGFPVRAKPVGQEKKVASSLSGLLFAEADRQNRVTNYLAACTYAYERSSMRRDQVLQLLFQPAAVARWKRRKQRNAAQL